MANGTGGLTNTDYTSSDYTPFPLGRRRRAFDEKGPLQPGDIPAAPSDVQPPLAPPPVDPSIDVTGPVGSIGGVANPALAQPASAGGPAPTAPPVTAPGAAAPPDVGTGAPPPLGPVLQRSRFALTQPPGNYQQVPSYAEASSGAQAGVPGAAQGMTKLGKLLTILRGAATGAAVGSTQPTFGTGFEAANQFQDQQVATQQQQQQRDLAIQQARQNLQFLPLQRAWQMEQQRQNALLNQDYLRARTEEMRQRSETEAARAQRQQQLATAPQKPIVSGDRLIRPALPSDDPDKVDENGYVDVGPAPAKPEKVTPEQQSYADAVKGYKAQGLNDQQIYQRMHPHEWQQQQAAAAAAPVAAPQALQDRIAQLPPEVQAGLQRFPATTQQALLALAHGDAPLNAWSARGNYKNNPGGLTQADAMGWARAINPSWDDTIFAVKKSMNQRYTNSKAEGGQLEAFSNFLRHAGDAADVTAKWRDKFLANGSPWINTAMNKLRDKLAGDPDYTQFVAALAPVKKEYMSFLNANRAEHSEDLQLMDKVINPDSSTPAQIEAALKQMSRTAILRLDSLDQNYRTGTGGEQYPNLITPQAKKAAAKLGFGDAVAQYGSGGSLPGYGQNAPTPQAAPAAPKKSKGATYGVEIQ